RNTVLNLLLSSLCALCVFAVPSSASDAKEPYRILLVVHIERNRLLTDVFRQQFTRELRDAMQGALGELARVEATDKHPVLQDIRARGLTRALDGYRERDGRQVHFVMVSLSGVYYEIQTRQYNGSLGLSSPVVRKARTDDPAFVTRTATL